MPEIDIRKKYTHSHKLQKRRKKSRNPFVAFFSGLFPWVGDTASDVARKLVFMVSLFALTFSGVLIADHYLGAHAPEDYSGYNNIDLEDDTREIWINPNTGSSNSEQGDYEYEVIAKYLPLLEENPEFVGYLSIDPWVSYPVAQPAGDTAHDHYLHHNFRNQPTENGTLFACKFGAFSPPTQTSSGRPDNVIVHGHNLLTKNLFQPLMNYRDHFHFLQANPIITFDTLFEPGRYKIISVFQTNIYDDLGEYYNYAVKRNFEGIDDFYTFVTEVLDRSRYHTNVDIRPGDEFLTLTTCDFSMLDNIRLVVVARRVRFDEAAEMSPEEFINLRGSTSGRDANGFMRYKMFEVFYNHLNRGIGWAGREWDTSLVEGLDDWLRNNEHRLTA
jgi:sortase B